jgi:hypothetical protein
MSTLLSLPRRPQLNCQTSSELSLSLSLTLRPTASRSVCLGIKRPFGAYDQIFINLWQLRFCFYGAPSLSRRRIWFLYMLLDLASVVFIASESIWTCDHISLSQIWDFPSRRPYDSQSLYCCYGRLTSESPGIVSVGTCLPSRCSETTICLFAYCIATAVLGACFEAFT